MVAIFRIVKYIFRFDITVNYTASVTVRNSRKDLSYDLSSLLLFKRLATLHNLIIQFPTAAVFGYKIIPLVILIELYKLEYILMVKILHDVNFMQESLRT